MKKKLAIILAAVMLLSFVPLSAFGAEKILITIDGSAVIFPDGQPFVDGSFRTLAPISPVAQAMGMSYSWDDNARVATFAKNYTANNSPLIEGANESHSSTYYLGKETVSFTIGSKNVVYQAFYYDTADMEKAAPVSDKTYSRTIAMDTTAVLRSHRTYAPIKYLAETLGYTVVWHESAGTVAIHSNTNDNPFMRVELLGSGNNHLAFAVFKGRLFDAAAIESIKFNGAKMGTDTCAYQNFTDKELALIKTNFGADYLTGTRITEKFFSGRKSTVVIYFTITYKTGLTVPTSYTMDYTYSGSGNSGDF